MRGFVRLRWGGSRPLRRWLLPVAAVCLLGYTFDQLWNGERGLVTWRLMHGQVQTLAAQNAALKADVARLENATSRMKTVDAEGRGKALDEDFLDEYIRRFLPLKKNGELILLP